MKIEIDANTKVFISHSSKDKDYGNALVELLVGIGIRDNQIIFTSNVAYGIPIGQNIFNWLKARINENPFVIYLLSPNYYSSIACLNEMGAAWVIENKHAIIFTPKFKVDSYEFQNGVLDPRQMGFYINDQDKVTAFIESLRKPFSISTNQVLINQKSRDFITKTNQINKNDQNEIIDSETTKVTHKEVAVKQNRAIAKKESDPEVGEETDVKSRFITDLQSNKLKDEEILLIKYIVDTARYKLGTGWQERVEIENIEIWEDINDYNDILSRNYAQAIRRFEIKKLVKVSDLTSHGNPKEFKVVDQLIDELFNLPQEFDEKFKEILAKKSAQFFPF